MKADRDTLDTCSLLRLRDEPGVTLVHRAFESGSSAQRRRVLDALIDLTPVHGAEEVAVHATLARPFPPPPYPRRR